jgi:hypothetical protein
MLYRGKSGNPVQRNRLKFAESGHPALKPKNDFMDGTRRHFFAIFSPFFRHFFAIFLQKSISVL